MSKRYSIVARKTGVEDYCPSPPCRDERLGSHDRFVVSCFRTSLLFFVAAVVLASGCAERKMAPELKYSQTEANELRKKIDNFDW